MNSKSLRIVGILIFAFLQACKADAFQISGGQLVEDFTTFEKADFSASTGLWDAVNHRIRAGVVANESAARPVGFGDGSDGALSSSAGFAFNTNTHPSGYNFTSVSITGGAVTVTGSNALIIRSLGSVAIVPVISVAGSTGTAGAASAGGTVAGPTGGTTTASAAVGGAGGAVQAGVGASNGGSAINFDGTVDAGTPGGVASSVSGAAGQAPAASSFNGPGNFDVAIGFVGGASGAGGGGHSAIPPDASQATGGAGGGGGGAVRIAAVGAVSLTGVASAAGGTGGTGALDASACSASGGGGNGGAVWLQSLGTVTAPAPNVNAGTGGAGAGCILAGPAGIAGVARTDAPAVAGGVAQTFDTTNTAPSQTYVVYSKGYNLGVLNANFTSATADVSLPNGGSVTVDYAGSVDDSTYSDFVSDVTKLNSRSFRFLKFKVTITTAGVAGASPLVTRVATAFTDAGLERVELKLSPGCGTIYDAGNSNHSGPPASKVIRWFAFWALVWAIGYGAVRTPFRLDSK